MNYVTARLISGIIGAAARALFSFFRRKRATKIALINKVVASSNEVLRQTEIIERALNVSVPYSPFDNGRSIHRVGVAIANLRREMVQYRKLEMQILADRRLTQTFRDKLNDCSKLVASCHRSLLETTSVYDKVVRNRTAGFSEISEFEARSAHKRFAMAIAA